MPLPKELRVTYFGSDIGRGTTPFKDRDILILVGGSFIPKNAFRLEVTSATNVKGGRINFRLANKCKRSQERGSMVNMLGRIKDPSGQRQNIVFALGVTKKNMEKLTRVDGVPSPVITHSHFRKATSKVFIETARLWQKNYKWKNPEDIGVIGLLVSRVKVLKKVRQSSLLRCRDKNKKRLEKHKEELKLIVNRNKEILKEEHVNLKENSNHGYLFEYLES